MTVPQAKPQVVQLPASILMVDPEVQRALDTKRVEKIVADYNPAALGVVVVSRRANGVHHLIDGQHRHASVLVAESPETQMDCLVYEGLSKQDEAAMFRALNNTRTVPPLDRFRIRVIEGEPVAVAIHKILSKYGWALRVGKSDYSFAAASAIEKVWHRSESPEEVIDRLVWAVTEAWSGTADAMRAEIIGGVGSILARHGDAIDLAKLVARLSEHSGGPRGLVGRARSYRDARGGLISDAMATILITELNYKRTVNRLPEWQVTA